MPSDAEETPRIKVVYDTGVLLQSVISRTLDGPATRALRLMDDGKIVAYISPRLRSEYEAILNRPSIRTKYPILTDEVADKLLLRVDTKAIFVHPVPPYLIYRRDPNDEPILNLAIHVQADFIVARDNDLLDLKDAVRGVRVVDPVEFLQIYSQTRGQRAATNPDTL